MIANKAHRKLIRNFILVQIFHLKISSWEFLFLPNFHVKVLQLKPSVHKRSLVESSHSMEASLCPKITTNASTFSSSIKEDLDTLMGTSLIDSILYDTTEICVIIVSNKNTDYESINTVES